MKLLGKHVKETLKYMSPRRKPGSSSLNFLDSGVRRNDEYEINQRLPKKCKRHFCWNKQGFFASFAPLRLCGEILGLPA